MATRSGEASINVVADFGTFAAEFQRGLDRALSGITIDVSHLASQISVGIGVGVEQAGRELEQLGNEAESVTNGMARDSERAGRSMAESFRRAGDAMSGVGDQLTMSVTAPLAAAGAFTLKTAGDFEKAMNAVKAATGAVGPEFTALRNEAIDLGATTAFSASGAAEAMNNLATAGFSVTDILAAVPGVLNLASAGVVDLGTAAEIAGNILGGFGIKADRINWVNDILTKTFLATSTSLQDLGESFKYVGPVAKSVGMSFETANAAIGLLGNAGIKGSEAGTALRGALVALVKPSNDAVNTMKDLGITVVDSQGKLLPLVSIIDQLAKSGADTAQMMSIFGLEAGPAMQALVSQGSGALAQLTADLQNAGGTAKSVADIQMQGLNGAMDNLSSSAEGLMIAIGDAGLLRVMTQITTKVTEWVAALSKLSPQLLWIATVVLSVAAAIGPFLAIVGRMSVMIGEGIVLFKRLGPALKAVGAAFTWLGTTPIGLIVLALAAVVAGLVIAFNTSRRFHDMVVGAFRAVQAAALDLWQSAIVPAFSAIREWMGRLVVAAVQLWQQSRPVWVALGAAVVAAWGIIRPVFGYLLGVIRQVGVAIVALYNGSIRQPLSNAIGMFQRFAAAASSWWTSNGAGVFAKAAVVISAFWTTTVGPALRAMIAVIKIVAGVVAWAFINVTLPAIKILIEAFGELVKTGRTIYQQLVPAFNTLAPIVAAGVGAVVVAVRWLAATIGPVLGSMGSQIASWWGPVSGVVMTVLRAVGTVIMWLWNSVGKTAFEGLRVIIVAFAAVVASLWNIGVFVFKALAATILTLWTVGVAVFNAIGAVFTWLWGIASAVFNGIKAAIGAVVGAVQAFWGVVGPAFMAIAGLVWSVWSLVFAVVFASLKIAFGVVAAAAMLLWSAISAAFSAIGAVFTWIWGYISPIFSAIGASFMWWLGVAGSVLSAIGGFFVWLWGYISPFFSWLGSVFAPIGGQITWLWGVVSGAFSAIAAWIGAKIGEIVSFASGIGAFVTNALAHFTNFVNGLRGKIDNAADVVRGLPGRIQDAIGNLGSLLYNAGANVINGLIDGIASRIGALRAKIADAAASIRNALPFSPAKEGPLSGKGDPTIAGGKIVDMIAVGIEGQIPALRLAAYALADAARTSGIGTAATATTLGVTTTPLSAAARGTGQPAPATPAAAPAGNTYNLTVNALDPKAASASVIAAIAQWERDNGKTWRS